MINLLTVEEQLINRRDYRRRRLLAGFGFLAGLLLIVDLLLLTAWIIIVFQNRSLKLISGEKETQPLAAEHDSLVGAVTDLQQALKQIAKPTDRILSERLLKLYTERPAGIIFTGLSIATEKEKSVVILTGQATRRANLLDYVATLERSGRFEKVDVPLPNLLAEVNPEFTINLIWP